MRRRPFLGMRRGGGGSRRPPRGYRCPGSRRAARPPPRARIRRSRRKADSARARPHPPWRRAAPWSSHTPPHRARRGVGPGDGRDRRGVLFEQGPLGARRVVLGERGDVLEEGATHLVVEPHRRDRLGRRGEPAADVGLEGGPEVLGPRCTSTRRSSSLTALIVPSCEATRGADAPVAIGRQTQAAEGPAASGGEEVAIRGPHVAPGRRAAPPRSTYWLTMNLPLYSPTAPGAARKPGYGEYALWVHSHTPPKSRVWPGGVQRGVSSRSPATGWLAATASHSASVAGASPASGRRRLPRSS